MIQLIIGGAFQGKREYAAERFHLKTEEIAEGESCEPEACLHAKCVHDFHLVVRSMMLRGEDPFVLTERMLTENPNAVIIFNEVGCGIIPLEKTERMWRETMGRIGCRLAAAAENVIRINCGLASVLKGELS